MGVRVRFVAADPLREGRDDLVRTIHEPVPCEGDGNESPSSGTVTLRRDMLLDDPTSVVWDRLLLGRDLEGNGSVTEHRAARRCQRGGGELREFHAEPRP